MGAALVTTAAGSSVQSALEGLANRSTLKTLSGYDGARAYLREYGREGVFVFRSGNYSNLVAADPREGLHIAANTVPASEGAWARQVDGHFNVKWWGAKGDSATDDSIAVQAAIDTINALGGGTLFFPPGNYVFQNVRLRQNVRILGAGRGVNGFSASNGNTVFMHPPTPMMDGIADITVIAGGTGYTSAPTVTITGGGGAGATATATVAGGILTAIDLQDAGYGYSSPPTILIAGGGGSGAAASVSLAARLFYSSGPALLNVEMSDFTMLGAWTGATQGLYLHHVHCPIIHNINAYRLGLEAVRWDHGAGGTFYQMLLFGCGLAGARTSSYRTGTLRIGGTDCRVQDVEAGAPYGSPTTLANCAMYFAKTSGAGAYSNLIAEGGDVGIYIEGAGSRFVSCRADINYGHGFWLNRTDTGTTPPWQNKFIGCWAHRNSKYGTGQFDNFRIEAGQSIARTTLVAFRSSNNVPDGWLSRYGIWNGASDSVIIGYESDGTESAGKYFNGTGNTAVPGPVLTSPGYSFLSAAATLNVTGLREVRLTNSGGAVTVTDLSGGNHGDEIFLHTSATNVTLAHGGTAVGKLYLAGQQSRQLTQWAPVMLRNAGGTWYEAQPWSKQATVSALAVSANTGTLPIPDGVVTIANAASPTNIELLEYCREQDARINALRVALSTSGITF